MYIHKQHPNDIYVCIKMDVPRFLSSSEIDDIIDKLNQQPIISSKLAIVSDVSKKSILTTLKNQLKLYKIKPKAIPEIYPELLKKFTITEYSNGEVLDTRIKPNMPVGVSATEALCQPITQMVMKSFHVAGSAKSASESTQAIKEITSASKSRKTAWAKLYFKNYPTFEEVYNKIPYIVSTPLRKVISKSEIMWYSSPEWWWEPNVIVKQSQPYVRIHLDTATLLEREISMKSIAKSIEKFGDSLQVMYSPLTIGMIDIIPISEMIFKYCLENFSKHSLDCESKDIDLLYIDTIILGKIIKYLHLKGIPHITSMIPYINPVLGICIKEQIYSDETQEYMIYLDIRRMEMFGIQKQRLIEIFEMYYTVTDDDHVLRIKVNSADDSPFRKVSMELEKSKPEDRLSRLCYLITAETTGTNLRRLFTLDDIDTYNTISNDFGELSSLFGIECCRLHMMKELSDLIKDKEDINGRHILLMGDSMTRIGELTPINYLGVVKQQTGVIAKVAYERGYVTLANYAGMGTVDTYLDKNLINVCPTATSILIGQVFTDAKNYIVKPADYLKKLREIAKDPSIALTQKSADLVQGREKSVDVSPMKEIVDEVPVSSVEEGKILTCYSNLFVPQPLVTMKQIDVEFRNFIDKVFGNKEFIYI